MGRGGSWATGWWGGSTCAALLAGGGGGRCATSRAARSAARPCGRVTWFLSVSQAAAHRLACAMALLNGRARNLTSA